MPFKLKLIPFFNTNWDAKFLTACSFLSNFGSKSFINFGSIEVVTERSESTARSRI
jgi:hypothetical protein